MQNYHEVMVMARASMFRWLQTFSSSGFVYYQVFSEEEHRICIYWVLFISRNYPYPLLFPGLLWCCDLSNLYKLEICRLLIDNIWWNVAMVKGELTAVQLQLIPVGQSRGGGCGYLAPNQLGACSHKESNVPLSRKIYVPPYSRNFSLRLGCIYIVNLVKEWHHVA